MSFSSTAAESCISADTRFATWQGGPCQNRARATPQSNSATHVGLVTKHMQALRIQTLTRVGGVGPGKGSARRALSVSRLPWPRHRAWPPRIRTTTANHDGDDAR
eukprot:1948669-Rhodomonas_salina.2